MEFKNYMGIYASSGDVQTAIDNGQLNKPYVALVGNEYVDYNSKKITNVYSKMPLTFEIISGGTFSWIDKVGNNPRTIEYSINGAEWTEITSSSNPSPISYNAGDIIQFRGNNSNYYYNNLLTDSKHNVYGNIMSLIDSTGFTTATTLVSGFTFNSLFESCTGLTDASNLILPATTLADWCYYQMFYYCTSLTTAPELPATTLTEGCYAVMFGYCSNLNYIKCLATDISANDCTTYWLDGVASSGTFVKAAGMNGWTTGSSGIPENWTVVDAS